MASENDDGADAQLITDVAAALRRWQQHSGRPAATKVLRETVWFFWQNPRLDRPLVAGKYPRSARWSREAADVALSAEEEPSGRLVIEHVEPMHRLLRRMIDTPHDAEDIAGYLNRGLEVVVVTKPQSDALPDDGDPEERYRAAGLELHSFRSLDDWEDLMNVQMSCPEQLVGVRAGDALWDMTGREWAVVDVRNDGLRLEDAHGDLHVVGWHGLLTLGAKPAPPT